MQMNDGGARMTYNGGGMREPSTGKGAYELVSPFALERIAKWYELGAQKYADRNWEKGIPFGRLIQSGLRHMIRWMQGRRDEDHLAAVCWNVMAMMHFEETGQDGDWNDYPTYKREHPQNTEVVELYADDKIIDRIVKPAYARRSAYVAKPDPSHRDYKIIAVDFDGCLCKNAWPEIGEANRDVISGLIASKGICGDKLILWTCREGKALQEALDWCKGFCLEFDAVNENLPELIERYGGDCRKISADEYWDDKAVNVKA